MPKYLIIGGNGIVGHFLTRRLVKEGHRPVVMSRGGDTGLINDVVNDCDNVRGDMTDGEFVNELVRSKQISHIVHLGAALPTLTEVDPAQGIRLNTEGAAHVLEAAKRNGVKRVVMASSKAVYGRVGGDYAPPTYKPVPESHVPHPDSIYGISKWMAERVGRWYHEKHGIEFIALRFSATIGPGKIARHGGSFSRYSVILEHAMAGKPVDISHNGDEICDALYNDEAARGIMCALHVPTPGHDVYNISTGTGFTLRQYAAAVKRLFPQAEISVGAETRPTSTVNCVLDPSLARQELDFVADTDIDRTVAAYVKTMALLKLAPG